ncbi:hypothetical protein N9Y09_01420 [Candidatus Actinomarina sp.]|jgi:hypothetical protein|nr:hypothetical protein [Actinomycetota bacterium]MDA7543456.1 hypothetical protein [Acidimicrobiia bacterium]MDA7572572.1 hypothetical protein [bacterium]MDA9608354.1 hypothetical protein [Candidatus Actinomarina sp.]RPH00360.1 MAG: hypothetical protein CBD81_003035 [bacterium TMED221]|tara:strand:- start:2517 stop:2741 length:225 start_codon:yes stop_codon:yes gene_type:complete
MVIVNPWITLLSFVYFIVAGFGAFIFSRFVVENYLEIFRSKFFKFLEPVVGISSFSLFFGGALTLLYYLLTMSQ